MFQQSLKWFEVALTNTYHINSVQTEQNTGCRKNLAT